MSYVEQIIFNEAMKLSSYLKDNRTFIKDCISKRTISPKYGEISVDECANHPNAISLSYYEEMNELKNEFINKVQIERAKLPKTVWNKLKWKIFDFQHRNDFVIKNKCCVNVSDVLLFLKNNEYIIATLAVNETGCNLNFHNITAVTSFGNIIKCEYYTDESNTLFYDPYGGNPCHCNLKKHWIVNKCYDEKNTQLTDGAIDLLKKYCSIQTHLDDNKKHNYFTEHVLTIDSMMRNTLFNS